MSKAPKQSVVVVEEPREVTTNEQAVLAVIERAATDPTIDIEKMERLLLMQERIFDRSARGAFQSAFADMQRDMPKIEKDGKIVVNGQLRGKYLRFEDINEVMAPILSRYGFGVSFRIANHERDIEITAILMHRGGHSEQTSLSLPHDTSGAKNSVQAMGSTVAYGKRYTLCAILNISAIGEDDDGNHYENAKPKPATQPPQAKANANSTVTPKQIMWIAENLTSRGIPETEFLAHFEIGAVKELQSDKTRDAKHWIEAWQPPESDGKFSDEPDDMEEDISV